MKTKLKEIPKEIALRLLIDNLDDSNDYILLLSQWNSNEQDRKLGLLTEENYRMYKARIEHGLNAYIEDLSEDDVVKVLAAVNLKNETPPSRILSMEELKFMVLEKISSILETENCVIGRSFFKELNLDEYWKYSNEILYELFSNGLIDEPIEINSDILVISKITIKGKEYLRQKRVSTAVEGGNDIIQGVSDSKIFVIKEKNVVTGSDIKTGGNLHIGDVIIYGKDKEHQENKKYILFLASNPFSKARLNLEKEHSIIVREIQDKSAYVVQATFAVSKIEMNEAVDDSQPTILHFSGHGSGHDSNETGLIFHNDDKSDSEVLNARESQIIFKGLKEIAPNLKIIILNACYSEGQAIAISQNGLYAIGTSNSITDTAAIAFAKGFYRKYTQNENLEKAIRFGIIQANTTLQGRGDANDLIHLFFNGVEVKFIAK